jgi:UDP-N-acetylglucosamine acyltransferase
MLNANIESTAHIAPGAELASDVKVGRYSIIGPEVKMDSGCEVGDHCVITGHTTIGKNCRFFTGAVIGSSPQDLKYKGEDTELIIGDNNVIREYVTINLGTVARGKTVLGNNNLIMAYVHIAHDCRVGNGVVMANAATLAGHVDVQDNVIIGGLTPVSQFIRIGKFAFIAGASGVDKDVPPFCRAAGSHPLMLFGLNTVGLKRNGMSPESIRALKKAYMVLCRGHQPLPAALAELGSEEEMTPEVKALINFIEGSKKGICKSRSNVCKKGTGYFFEKEGQE